MENVHWSSLRRGDVILVQPEVTIVVLAVDFHGRVWDANGGFWYNDDDDGAVTRLKPTNQFDRDMHVLLAYSGERTRKIKFVSQVKG